MTSYFGPSVVWPNYSATNVQNAARTPKDTLGKDQFLSILVAQLRNQDPMAPMNDTEFIAQMAQFTSVEQLMNMSSELALIRQNMGTASSLIGKNVSWNEYDSNGEIVLKQGIVDSIVSSDGNLYVEVNGERIGIDFIHQISIAKQEEETDVETSPESTDENESNNESAASEVGSS